MRTLLLLFAVLAAFMLSGCVLFNAQDVKAVVVAPDIKAQDGIISADMASAQALMAFQEQGALSSFTPGYQNTSDEIGAACAKLDSLDSTKNSWSNQSKAVCENKKGLDDCFFQIEKIKAQVKAGDPSINLDTVDVLCKDIRSVGLQSDLNTFKTQYKAYGAWLAAENDISARWDNLSSSLSNSSSVSELNNAKMSDYYQSYRDISTKAQASLQAIKGDCALKGSFNATSSKVEKVCNNTDTYISDMDKSNAIVLDTFNFFGQLESGTVTIDSAFVGDCDRVSAEYSGLYDLKLMKDTTNSSANQTGLDPMCRTFENLSTTYNGLGIPLVLENGALSPTTKTELFKAKTVYVDTDTKVGSGVILASDSSGYYILTNAHVALEYDTVTGSKYAPSYVHVKFYGGRVGYADKLAYDREGYDFVLLHVPSSGNYPAASYDPTHFPRDGDKVVAVGNPYGLEFSVTQGTVSGERDMGCLTDYCYGAVIQTDTSINPGNSGGGLWDYDSGELLGINSLGLTEAKGINFAISMYQYDKVKDTFKWFSLH